MRVLNKYNVLFIIFIVLLAAYFLFFVSIKAENKIPDKIQRAEINHTTIYLTEVRSLEERSLGLGGRDTLLEDHGMIFVFEKKDLYAFWMKGMRFPLDMIWLNDNIVVDITKNAPVVKSGEFPRYTSKSPANYVIEVNAGFTDKYNINIGDQVKFK